MDYITLTVLFKGFGMILALFGGILAIHYGYKLYKDGVGGGRDHVVFEIGALKAKAHSVGSVVMVTAFLWAWAGVAISPSLDKRGDDVHVYSFNSEELSIEVPAFAIDVPRNVAANITDDAEALKLYFNDALVANLEMKIRLNGEPATLDRHAIGAIKTKAGTYLLTGELETANKSVTIGFSPEVQGDVITFVPTGLGAESSE